MVGGIEEVADAVFQSLERRDKGKELSARNDAIVRRVHVTKLPNRRHDQRVGRTPVKGLGRTKGGAGVKERCLEGFFARLGLFFHLSLSTMLRL